MRLALALAALLLAAPATAHVRLERSTPAAGAIVHAPLAELRVVFSAAVAARYTRLVVRAPSGDVLVLDSLRPDPASGDRAFFIPAPRLPEPGEYRVEWRTAGADGHVLTGFFTFVADSGAVTSAPAADSAMAPAAPPAADPGLHEHHAAAPPSGVFASQSPLHVAVRALQLMALLALIGALALRRLLLGAGDLAEHRAALERRRRNYTALLLSLFLLLLPLRLWLQSGALHGPASALDPSLVASMLVETGWGNAWLAQLALAGIAALTFATPLIPLAELAVLGLAFTPGFLGHAAGMTDWRSVALAAHGVHVLAAGLWLGTLAALFTIGLPALRLHDAGDAGRAATAVHRFSPLALGAAATAVAAGLLMALIHVGTLARFAGTPYGRTLALKLALLALVFLAGFLNWRRAGVRSAAPDLPALRRRITLELIGAAAVLLVTAVLSAVPPS